MFKKNSWIVALLLSLSVFMAGCIDPVATEDDSDVTYTEVELGKFNIGAGQTYQKGWAVAGLKWGEGPASGAPDLGYKIEDFQGATKLVLEMEDDSFPKGGLDIIWGGDDGNGSSAGIGDWNQQSVVSGGGTPDPIYAKKEGNILTIDLTRAIKNYATYKAPTTKRVKIILQANATGGPEALVAKGAKLLIPDLPFIPVKDVTLSSATGYENVPFILNSTVESTNSEFPATNALVVWSIVSWLDKDAPASSTLKIDTTSASTIASSKAALLAVVDFQDLNPKTPEIGYWDYTTEPWTWIVTTPSEPDVNKPQKSNTALKGIDRQGTLVMKATIEDGKLDAEGKETDFTKTFTITIGPKLPVKYKLDGNAKQTLNYEGLANTGESASMIVTSDDGSYTVSFSAGYGNCYAIFEVDFGTETYADYAGIKFKYQGVAGDSNFKDVRLYGDATAPAAGQYAPGTQIGTTKAGTGDALANAVQMDAPFTSQSFNSANKVYLWITPWGGGMSFTISDIDVYKAAPCECGTATGTHVCDHGCGTATAEWCDCVCTTCNPPNVTGTYTVPTAGAGEFYLDLGGNMAGYFNTTATPGATRKVEANKVTYYINKADQGIYIPLSASAKAAVKTALTGGSGQAVKVTIVGTATPDSTLRYGLADPTAGSNWNGTNLVSGAFSTILTGTLTEANSSVTTDALLDAFIFHARSTGKNTALAITSIKIVIE